MALSTTKSMLKTGALNKGAIQQRKHQKNAEEKTAKNYRSLTRTNKK